MMIIAKRLYSKFNLFFRLINPIINIQTSFLGLMYYFSFFRDYKVYNRLSKEKIKFSNLYPYLSDNTKNTGFDTHYIYHTAWAARVVKEINPHHHIDISSSLYFCALVSAFIPVEFYDFRPAKLNLTNLKPGFADLTKLHFDDNSLESLSCMHTVEHIGLGRYGDPIDPEGDKKAISELKRVVKLGGHLLFVVPIGKPKLMFNAHRIYSFDNIIEYFKGFELKQFALIPDKKEQGFINPADPDLVKDQDYGCGCFWFVKISCE